MVLLFPLPKPVQGVVRLRVLYPGSVRLPQANTGEKVRSDPVVLSGIKPRRPAEVPPDPPPRDPSAA